MVKLLKEKNPNLSIEINGGFTNLNQCIKSLNYFDGVMIGRSAYKHPLHWSKVDEIIYGKDKINKKISLIIYSLIPYFEKHINEGGKAWDICKHLINLIQGLPKAKIIRNYIAIKSIKKEFFTADLIKIASELTEMGY